MMLSSYVSLCTNVAFLAFEAQSVIGLRLLKIALGGPAAEKEWHRMFSEKATAVSEIGQASAVSLASGKDGLTVGHDIVRGYRQRVRSNRKRLS